ncbi:MAG: DUF1444 family protein [Acidobacteriota bacterium]
MISKFKNLFKKTDLDEKNAFRSKVIEVLEKKFPEYTFTEGEDLDQIKVAEITLGLTNLRAKFLLTSQTSNDLEGLIEEQFSTLPKTFEFAAKFEEKESWEKVKSLVMPQIMPVEYASQFNSMSFPLGDEVLIGCVIDDEKAYRYIIKSDLENWQVSAEEVYQEAIKNLEEKSVGIEMTVVPLPTGLVVVNTMDSFDAARILLPNLRKFFAENIGTPFYFGIPNRDFLICFSAEMDDETQNNIRRQIADDFEERPYSLSKSTFIVDGKNEIKQLYLTESNKINNFSNLN